MVLVAASMVRSVQGMSSSCCVVPDTLGRRVRKAGRS
jgi:hypothetical protein